MFEIGEYILYGRSGICQVTDITRLSMAGIDRKKEYYVLTPLNNLTSKIYFPVDKEEIRARRLISEEEAGKLMDEIRNISELPIENEKSREDVYKEAVDSFDDRKLIAVIKTLYFRREERLNSGKKAAAVDEKYLKMAEDALYSELAFVLKKEKEEIPDLIRACIEKSAF